ncbi:hypothetical protein DASC09_008240 [Saccharomycopsis crataegensis]|uniref:CBS domain-containing protein n=1 Tax=Saccharomycopsis crataegensis TaxID=43959 RepID=A0AAV5QFR0_9ASCO|nr:hypothetical protein DASC09_008240 [Saccharomycopsis crataegensis]
MSLALQSSDSRSQSVSKSAIMAWNTDLPIICSPFESTFNIAKLMESQRNNCALVKDFGRNKIIGIFTAKDLAFKVVSKGLHPKFLKAKDIMTPNPICATVDEPASSALNKMIRYKIRHLPVLNAQGECIGLLDITKCFDQTLSRLRKLHESSKQLNEALMEVQENIANMAHDNGNVDKHSAMYYQAQDMVLKAKNNINSLYQNNLALTGDTSGDFEDFEMLLNLMESPTLKDVLNLPNQPQTLFIDANNTIRNASDIMKKNNTTAVLVRDTTTSAKSVIGILTTKDIVYRVLAQDNEPDFTIISRVMTPSPEFGDENMGIVEAFELMFKGKFLNLPVTNEMQNVSGIVSVMQLTSMALSQLHKGMMSSGVDGIDSGEYLENPFFSSPLSDSKWDNFWGAIDSPGRNFEDETLKSDYSIRSSGPAIRSTKSTIHSTKKKSVQSPRLLPPSQSVRSFNGTAISNLESPIKSIGYYQDDMDAHSEPSSEISPEDSISCYIPPESEINSVVSYASEIRKQQGSALIKAQQKSFGFKIKDLDDNDRVYKIKIMLPKSKNLLPHLKNAVEDKLGDNQNDFNLSYVDEDGDMVTIMHEEDLKTCMEISRLEKKASVVICLSRKQSQDEELSILKDIAVLKSKMDSTDDETVRETTSGVADLLLKPEVLISGALLTMSLGILLGVTLSRQR